MTKIRTLLCDPKWITALLLLAAFAGGATTWAFGEWQLRGEVRTHLEATRHLPEWQTKIDEQIELLTYLACRNEEAHHPEVTPLQCEKMKREHAGRK